MMIRILKTSHGHPFYRANRSKNQKLIQGDETVESKYKNATVRRSSTGRCNIVERSTLVQGASSNGRVSWRPVDQKLFLPLATNSSSLQVPPMTKFSWSNPDSSIDQDTSYASIASMAKVSFCKACFLSKLGSRPSYAKDTKAILFHSYIVSKDIFVDSSTHIADFSDIL